jgi:hypothetical protein
MSIINEALKKAGEEKQKREEKSEEFVSTYPKSQGLKKETFLKRNLIAGAFLLGVLCIIAITVSLTSMRKIGLLRREGEKTISPAVSVESSFLITPRMAKTEEQALSPKKEDLSPSIYPSPPEPRTEVRQKSGREVPLPLLSLEGIVWDKKKPLALINNKVLGEGEIIKGAKIVKINKREVKLIFQGREFILRVH